MQGLIGNQGVAGRNGPPGRKVSAVSVMKVHISSVLVLNLFNSGLFFLVLFSMIGRFW